jgi:hypothetical protein
VHAPAIACGESVACDLAWPGHPSTMQLYSFGAALSHHGFGDLEGRGAVIRATRLAEVMYARKRSPMGLALAIWFQEDVGKHTHHTGGFHLA